MTDTTKKVTKTVSKKAPAPVVAPEPTPDYCRASKINIANWRLAELQKLVKAGNVNMKLYQDVHDISDYQVFETKLR